MSGGPHCVFSMKVANLRLGWEETRFPTQALRDFANRWSRFAPFNRAMNDARRSTGTVKHRVERLHSM